VAETIEVGPITFIVAPEQVEPPQPAPVRQPEPEEEKCSAPQCAASRNAKITYFEGGGSSRKMGSDGYYTLNYLAK